MMNNRNKRLKGTPVHARGWWFGLLNAGGGSTNEVWFPLRNYVDETLMSEGISPPSHCYDELLLRAFHECFDVSGLSFPFFIVFARVGQDSPREEEEYEVVLDRREGVLGFAAGLPPSKAKELAISFLARMLR